RLGGISEISELEAFSDYARVCGRTLARAHARSGDPAIIAGYMGKSEAMDDALASFAMAYAEQTSIDHAALVKAKSNRDKKKLKLGADWVGKNRIFRTVAATSEPGRIANRKFLYEPDARRVSHASQERVGWVGAVLSAPIQVTTAPETCKREYKGRGHID